MSLQSVSSRYFFLGFIYTTCFLSICFIRLTTSSGLLCSSLQGNNFILDFVSLSFTLLSVFLLVGLLPVILVSSVHSYFLIMLSVLFSILSYSCTHALMFWGFYELSILFLLVLLILDSPYSERYLAGWYLLGYVVFTSLPMFISILWISLDTGSYSLLDWSNTCLTHGSIAMLLLLSVLFITKIPLFPFHVWLPIVHAEAPSPVSVCLSGYIMKLGVLGLYRFSYSVLPDYIFSPFYVFLVLVLTYVFFAASNTEIDGKRWLAFLSLAHIGFVCLTMCLVTTNVVYIPFYFCLGHGLSAGVTFVLLWLFYDLSSSRNWAVLKSSVLSGSYLYPVVVVCLFSVASVPPTLTFFSEVLFLNSSIFNSIVLSGLFSIYLFCGGLIPLFLLSFVLGRGYCVSLKTYSCWSQFTSLSVLCFFIYLSFFVL